MKILHYINNLGSGGAEKLLTDILPAFKNEGHEAHLLISNKEKNVKKYEDSLTKDGILVQSLNTSFYNPFQIFKVIAIIRKEKYDIVHAHLFPSQYWLAFASFFIPKNVKLVKTEHSVFNERKNYRLLKPLEKLVYSRYKYIIAITAAVKQNLSDWLNEDEKITVVHNGVNLKQIFHNQLDQKPDFLDSSKINLLMVARFDLSQKDQKSLIEALNLIEDKKNYHLYFAGVGVNLKNCELLVADLKLDNYVTFLGVRNDVYNLMNKINLNVLSTNHEGLSGVALEALASGKPFIASDVIGVNDIVPDESFLFPKQNPEKLAKKIIEVSMNKSLQNELVSKALKHVQNFDTPKMVNGYLSVYKKVINEA